MCAPHRSFKNVLQSTYREIRGYEKLKSDVVAWQGQSGETRKEIERNLQKKLSFVPNAMSSFTENLAALTDMLSEQTMCRVLCSNKLARSTASLVVHFIAKLAGPLRNDFHVEHMATVKFDPHGILVQVMRHI